MPPGGYHPPIRDEFTFRTDMSKGQKRFARLVKRGVCHRCTKKLLPNKKNRSKYYCDRCSMLRAQSDPRLRAYKGPKKVQRQKQQQQREEHDSSNPYTTQQWLQGKKKELGIDTESSQP